MKKVIALAIFFILLSISVEAATYYVRPDGGTATQCYGTSDKAYTPVISDVSHDCAFNHPYWVVAPKGLLNKMVGGDTLIIAPGQYQMGLGAPNTSVCSQYYPWDCHMNPVPSGTVTAPTRILGQGWDTVTGTKPQLWGNERVFRILNLIGSSNVEVQHLEVTDHSGCIENGPDLATKCQRSTYPYGPWAATGLEASDSQNVLIKNVDIHGVSIGVLAARLTNWSVVNTNITGNSFAGWNGDLGATTSSNSGTILFQNTKIQWSGCGERYPLTTPDLFSVTDKHHCYSQDQGGYGDGLGTNTTGGNWIFDHVDVSNNVSDGIDLLYHNGNGSIVVKNDSKFQGNAGNQVKVASSATIDASTLVGDCANFAGKPYTSTTANMFDSASCATIQGVWANGVCSKPFNNCRAGGSVLASKLMNGSKTLITNTKFLKVSYIAIESSGSACNGTEVIASDAITTFELLPMSSDPSRLAVKYYAAGQYGNGDGPCGLIKLTSATTPPPTTCVPNNSCSNLTAPCGQTVTCTDNCGTVFTKVGVACPVCVPDLTKCNAPAPAVNKMTEGIDNCLQKCYRFAYTVNETVYSYSKSQIRKVQ